MSQRGYFTFLCPDCGSLTQLASVEPILNSDLDQLTYLCVACDKEFSDTVKGKSLEGPR